MHHRHKKRWCKKYKYKQERWKWCVEERLVQGGRNSLTLKLILPLLILGCHDVIHGTRTMQKLKERML
jgi:hypothetical protein